MKVLITGGVAGGASTAARLRRLDEQAQIIMFERGEYISFANCGLPYYIGNVIKSRDKLLLQTPEGMRKRFNVEVRTKSEVKRIFPERKAVLVHDLVQDRTYEESYDTLVLSPGAEPLKPDLPGMDSDRIFTLRDVPDADIIKDFVKKNSPEKAVIVGAGYIGLELAENLHNVGVEPVIAEMADHVIGPLDYDMASIVHRHLKSKNIELYLNNAAVSFMDSGSFLEVRLAGGQVIKADMAVLGIGVRPESLLAKEAGLKTGKRGGIIVDRYMRTSEPDIYAVGDAVEAAGYFGTEQVFIPLAGPANRQGRTAANCICGRTEAYGGTLGTSILKLYELAAGITGKNERDLIQSGADYEKSYTHSYSHAGYYPGASDVSIKLLFEKKSGRILGAQVIGREGIDKRTDVLAAAISAGMTTHDLERLELCYAPPFSSARDPVVMAGYVASNIQKGDVKVFHWHEVEDIDPERSVLVDVRTPREFNRGTIKGAVNIPVDELRDRLNELPGDKDIYLFCRVGARAYVAYRILVQNGFERIRNLSGGYITYKLCTQ